MNIDTLRTATESDAEVITQLMNRAYRPETMTTGWTHESNWVSGQRTDIRQVKAVIEKPDSVVIVGLQKAEIIACVQVAKNGNNSHIGMLAVNPNLQGKGVGKQMLARAENYANKHFNATKFILTVMSARHELISFYLRRGYRQTGVVQNYPMSAGIGTPKFSDLQIETLEKRSLLNL